MKRVIVLLLFLAAFFETFSQTVVTRDSLLNSFVTGARPTQNEFHSWINSYYHVDENILADYARGLYLLGTGNTTEEEDGNIRFLFNTATRASLGIREGGTWYNFLSFPQHPSLSGRFLSLNHSTTANLGVTIENQDTVGQNSIVMTLPTFDLDTFSITQYYNRVEIESGSTPLLINGTAWPPAGGGGGLWSDLGGGSINYSGVTTRVGVNVTPSYTFHSQGDDDLFSTIQAAFLGNSGTDGLTIRNDGSVIQTGDQTVHIFDETLTSGPGSNIQWKRASTTRVQVGIEDDDLVLSTLAGGDFDGAIRLEADSVLISDGVLRVRSSAGSGMEIFQASDELGKVFVNQPASNSDVTFRKISSTGSDVNVLRIDGSVGDGTNFTPGADYAGMYIEIDSVDGAGTRDITGISILMDTTLSGIRRVSDGANPERTWPMRIYRNYDERGAVPKVVTVEGDVDMVASLYGSWALASSASPATSTGTIGITSAQYFKLEDPDIDTTLFSASSVVSNGITINYDTIFYGETASPYARYPRDVEITCNVAAHNTSATLAQFTLGISINGADPLTSKRYTTWSGDNSEAIQHISLTIQTSMSPGDFVYPVLRSNQAGAMATDVYQFHCSLKSID